MGVLLTYHTSIMYLILCGDTMKAVQVISESLNLAGGENTGRERYPDECIKI